MGGNYIEFKIDRDEIARYGLAVGDVQEVLEVALGGMPLTTTVEGLERYAVNLRYSRDFRENLEALARNHRADTDRRAGSAGPTRENRNGSCADGHQKRRRRSQCLDLRGRERHRHRHLRPDGAARRQRGRRQQGRDQLPSGYNIFWSGQYEYMLRAKQRLMIVVPLTLLIIILIIYLNTRSAIKTAIVMLAVPFSLVGAFWVLYWLGYNLSVAVWVGLSRSPASMRKPAS